MKSFSVTGLGSLCGLILLFGIHPLWAQPAPGQVNPPPAQTDTDNYIAPAGSAPPVAPPLRKGSPLDHLTNDPKYTALPVGYREGNTTGSDYWIAHRYIDDEGGQGWGWIRKSSDDWGDGIWIALQETLGVAVVLRFVREMGLDMEKVNVNGGAIAMGHPLGATGGMIIGTLIDELERTDGRYGLATLCVGGGMGIATVIERI